MPERFLALGLEIAQPGGEGFADFLKKQAGRFGAIARQSGIRAE